MGGWGKHNRTTLGDSREGRRGQTERIEREREREVDLRYLLECFVGVVVILAPEFVHGPSSEDLCSPCLMTHASGVVLTLKDRRDVFPYTPLPNPTGQHQKNLLDKDRTESDSKMI